ncbi:glycogen debranching N-terminal domain-containing protein [Nocardioides iriomotensis]|uniref:Amylo-alpha-1,6-glucosidase n=1 Tax=Nocardioides iriomotensis TaxID=715784 RepID=A0A4Q5IZ67_9ACTN|nr:glycogen debranching N-terminal domain-containing protein [Nocardioides iriomotensis]RYU10305.1 amylo-alpha-1,6-glucosidase [Nocardioides iriomotensis]
MTSEPDPGQQPWLHDLTLVLAAPTQVWSGADGQVRPGGAQGVLHGDRRLLDRLELTVDGEEPSPVAAHPGGAGGAGGHVFVAVPRRLGDAGPDPTVRVTRTRAVRPGELRESVALTSTAGTPTACTVQMRLAADLASMDEIKAGGRPAPVGPTRLDADGATWEADGFRGEVRAPGATLERDDEALVVTWTLDVPPGGRVDRELVVTLTDADAVVTAPAGPADWAAPTVVSADRRLGPALDQALADLRLLRLATTDAPGEEFVGAGAPWFLTLFGRDSLWAARMLLPVSTGLAGSTLRVLAARQGTTRDAATAEQPGKILHEVRATAIDVRDESRTFTLPPVYYGTIDATPLWAVTLHDAWRWGLPADEVEPLLPALERALAWQVEEGDPDGDFFLEYVDETGTGLANQGWKDSGDSIRRADGSLAGAPVALCEVQAYAYAAATRGADLLEAFGRSGTDRWRAWAEELRTRFRRQFWVEDARGAFPAIALDGAKQPVASVTSNIGHLLGTGLLDTDEVDLVARRLVGEDMLSGFGIRTLSSDARGYSPTGYHVGSVWPHDTAICLAGLAAEGRPEVAPVAEALLAAMDAFDGRPPELFAGDARAAHPVPLPYPAACRPQAWSAAGTVSLTASLLGLAADVPAGAVTASPAAPWPLGVTTVSGLRAGDRALAVAVDESGAATVSW